MSLYPNSRTVAAMMRSAGSRGGVPGRNDEVINRSVDISASRKLGASSRRRDQSCGLNRQASRPREINIPTSHAEMGEIYSNRPAPYELYKASPPGSVLN